jgi:hypothetical protein
MIEVPTDFAYLGNRDYVHGTSVLIGMLDALEVSARSPIRVKRLKFHRVSRRNGVFTLSQAGSVPESSTEANCTLLADAGGKRWHCAFIEKGLPVARREDVQYCIANFSGGKFSGSCDVSPRERGDLIRAIIEANKRCHESGIGPQRSEPEIRFGYLEDWVVPPLATGFSGRLEIANLITQKTVDGYRTINRIAYGPGSSLDTTLQLCFDVRLTHKD